MNELIHFQFPNTNTMHSILKKIHTATQNHNTTRYCQWLITASLFAYSVI